MFEPSDNLTAANLTAASPKQALRDRITLQERQIAEMLAAYEPRSATYAWFDTLRAIEECINLMTVDWEDDVFEKNLFSLPVFGLLQETSRFSLVRERLVARCGQNFGVRFTNLLLQSAACAMSFASIGIIDIAAAFLTVGSLIDYLQSRRRHFVGILHLLPTACRGRQIVKPLDTLNICLPIVELFAIQMMGAHHALLVKVARESLGLAEREWAELAMLDSFFLEPERAPITEIPMGTLGVEMLKSKEALRPDRIFSAAELRNDILVIKAAYAEFNLINTDFAAAAALVERLSTRFIDRDFWIEVSPTDLAILWDEVAATPALRLALINSTNNYMACLSTYAPLVLVGGVYRSTVTLLSRFVYHWRARSLDRQKRFQIRAGFIFEKAVAKELNRQGFSVQDITRINRREFDVVTLRGGVIWNVQCKNNFIDLEDVEADTQRFARYNRALVQSYELALTKERNREHLLKAKLSLGAIQHVVVSRFPIVSDNPRIIPFSRIRDFAAKANALVALNESQGQ